MTLDELEIEFKKTIGILFTDSPILYLCYGDKKTSFEVYAAIGDYFDEQEIMLSFFIDNDKMRISVTSLSTGDTINSNFIPINKENYNHFINKIDTDSIIQIFSGFTTEDFPVCRPNIVSQQYYSSLHSIGYNIIKV